MTTTTAQKLKEFRNFLHLKGWLIRHLAGPKGRLP